MREESGQGESDGGSIRVLLVEDERADLQRLELTLQCCPGASFELSHAPRVEQALSMLQEDSYDLVLLDLTLPEGKGVDIVQRARVAASSVPIVVMTDQADESTALESVRLGAQDYLIKGELSPQVVGRVLRHAVERHRLMRQMEEARQRANFLATRDSLTGLPNRYFFLDQLERAVSQADRSGKPLALFFIDLDGFKSINDTLGHPAGDELLKRVAECLSDVVGRSGVVARLGGDEFTILVSELDSEAAKVEAERVRSAIARTFRLGGNDYWVTPSIGIAIYPADGSDAEVLIRNADLAMYRAKSRGRNRASFYQDGMNSAAAERFRLANSLRDALGHGDLLLYYQPLVDLGAREVIGLEALLRWRHSERGLVSPRDFVPIAEETGLMGAIGDWVLAKACADCVSLERDLARGVPVSVNVSGRQLCEEDFADVVEAVLGRTGLAPDLLNLDVTEARIAAENPAVRQNLVRLRGLGVGIAVDDFGRGQSSLALLTRIPVDILKIHSSFVRGAASGGSDEIVVGGVISLARQLGITPVAVGVETAEEARALARLGCARMQGYLFAQPQPVEEFSRSLRSGQALWDSETDAMIASALSPAQVSTRPKAVSVDAPSKPAQREATLEADLGQAVENRRLRVLYQPRVELRTGRLNGFEALLRWSHPTLGQISPTEFIPIAEKSALITEIGAWVLREACEQVVEWAAQGYRGLVVSVNVSAHQFQYGDLGAQVAAVLQQSGCDPRNLELELTESAFLEEREAAARILHDLRAIGVRVALDDFGTGYSSLSYLTRLPLDTLKLDRCFVRDVDTDPTARGIATAVIAMAHSIGLRVVAEGVDDPAQAEILGEHGCDELQGFLISGPVAASACGPLLDTDPLLLQDDKGEAGVYEA